MLLINIHNTEYKVLLNNTSRIDEGNLRCLLNFSRNKIEVHHVRLVGHNTITYTMVFLHSAWLYFYSMV